MAIDKRIGVIIFSFWFHQQDKKYYFRHNTFLIFQVKNWKIVKLMKKIFRLYIAGILMCIV